VQAYGRAVAWWVGIIVKKQSTSKMKAVSAKSTIMFPVFDMSSASVPPDGNATRLMVFYLSLATGGLKSSDIGK
jgi:hypothetical protein